MDRQAAPRGLPFRVEAIVLIESLIKPHPKLFRTIPLFGKTYEFKQTLPDRYVAEVTDPLHIKTFLQNPAYRQFDETLPPATLSRAPQLQASGVTVPTKEDAPDGADAEDQLEDPGEQEDDGGEVISDEPGEWPTAVADEASVLLRNSAAKLATALGGVSSLDVIRCALALERNKTGRQRPREDVIDLLEGTLRDVAAAQAG